MPRPMPSVCLLSAILVSAGCHQGPPVRSYSPLDQVTRIEVKAELSDYLAFTIDDPATISRIVAFVNERRGGWGGSSDWAGVPVPQVSAYFYRGPEFKGQFGVGPGFFECQREGDFSSKRCEAAEERQFLELVEMPFHEFRR